MPADNRITWPRFTTRTLLFVTAIIAALLALVSLRLTSWVALLAVELIAGLVGVEVLVRNVPQRLRRLYVETCRRHDGSWSIARERIAKKALWSVRGNLAFALLVVFIPLNAVMYFVHTRVIPFDVGVDAVATVQLSSDSWKDALRSEGVEADYDRWYRSRRRATSAPVAKRLLWYYWPSIIALAVVGTGFGFVVIENAYSFSLSQLQRYLSARAQEFRIRDLA